MPALRREAAAALIVLLPVCVAGCGILGRQRDAYIQMQRDVDIKDPAARDAAFDTIRGAEPLITATWLVSASSGGDAAKALDLVSRGRAYQPTDPDLVLAQLSLLGQTGRAAEQVATAQADLAQDLPAGLRAQVMWFLVEGLLADQRIDDAAAQVVRLGGVPGARSEMISAAWSRVALAREVAGQSQAADAAFDACLDLGPGGLAVLRHDALAKPERQAAAGRLITRALARQPDHPDLHLYRVVDRMAGGDLDGAMTLLDALPQPLPDRLVPETLALRARLLLLQNRNDEGLACLRARLDDEPTDPFMLGVLIETWHVRGLPAAEEVAARLRAARKRVMDPALAAEMDATLTEIATAAAKASAAPKP